MLLFPQTYNNAITPYVISNCFSSPQLENLNNLINLLPFNTAKTDNSINNDDPKRKSKIKWIPQTSEYFWVYDKVKELIIYSNKEMWNFDLYSISESFQYTEYSEDYKGHYDWHVDIGDKDFSQRKLSITIQLSAPHEYEGGDLEFNFGGGSITSSPKEYNSCTIFPSYLLHRVTPVTKGIRKSLVLWVGGAPFR